MKNIYLFALLLSAYTSSYAQNVNIPDANFKSVLVSNPSINTNGDSEIQISEAATYTDTVNVTYWSISDLTGIEAFTAITVLRCAQNGLTSLNVSNNTALIELWCFNNPLTSLNLSANTNLITLDCSTNQLTSLNVSVNTALTHLNCGGNPLTSLNVSANTALTFLGCWFNQLTSLDVSANLFLTELYCHGNQLTSLNLSVNAALTFLWCSNNQLTSLNVKNGNNTNFTEFNAGNNPNLFCIQVDNVTYSNANSSWYKDATASYSQNCIATGIVNQSNYDKIMIYPNPSSRIYTLSLKNKTTASQIYVSDVLGNCLFIKVCENETNPTIDLFGQPKGIYFIEIVSVEERVVKKIVLE